MSNASEFLQIFTRLENWMKERVEKKGYMDFPSMIANLEGSCRQIHSNSIFLNKMGKLRNLIVHENPALAEPSKEVICKFGKIVESIMMPPKLVQYCTINPAFVSKSKFLPEVLRHMLKHDFSQVIVQDEGEYRLLSREGVSKWVEANIDNEFAIITGTKVSEVLAYEEKTNCEYVSRSTDVFAFIDIIGSPKKRVQAVIVTENGKVTEKPIGIATIWDAGLILSRLELF
ncbi:MAG: hypothetical protein WBI82_04220 [Sphaerochaeta sp.]